MDEEQAAEALAAWKRIYHEALEQWLTHCEEVLEIPRVLIFAEAGKLIKSPNEDRIEYAVRVGKKEKE